MPCAICVKPLQPANAVIEIPIKTSCFTVNRSIFSFSLFLKRQLFQVARRVGVPRRHNAPGSDALSSARKAWYASL
jgi:hypothetical protein